MGWTGLTSRILNRVQKAATNGSNWKAYLLPDGTSCTSLWFSRVLCIKFHHVVLQIGAKSLVKFACAVTFSLSLLCTTGRVTDCIRRPEIFHTLLFFKGLLGGNSIAWKSFEQTFRQFLDDFRGHFWTTFDAGNIDLVAVYSYPF